MLGMSTAAPAEGTRPAQPLRGLLTRRTVLGAAAAGGAGIAALRLLSLAPAAQQALSRARGNGVDWLSPLGSETARVNHLLRRTTFGASAAELEQARSDGYNRTLDRILETPPQQPPAYQSASGYGVNPTALTTWWFQHMLTSKTPFAERMTLFWHNHFTSDYRKVGAREPFIYWQNLTWRNMAMSDLGSMLMKVTTDPAMLRYLDLATSTGSNPNENYSRELMELFTLGVGNYSEDDVRAAAKALAGWKEPAPDGSVDVTLDKQNAITKRYPTWTAPQPGQFQASRGYRGAPFKFLGKTAAWNTDTVLKQLLAQPATAEFIARKVTVHFVTPQPDGAYVKRLADKFRSSHYDMRTLMREVFTSPEFTSSNYRTLVKSPIEYMVSVLKALGNTSPPAAALAGTSSHSMGQVPFDPPDVGGWPNNDSWVSSNTMLGRVNFATAALTLTKQPPAAASALEHLDSVLGKQTAGLLNHAADDHARWFLALASPEFQLK